MIYSAVPELSEMRRSLRPTDCGWLAGQAPVCHLGRKSERAMADKDRSIALCLVRHSLPFLPFSCRASIPNSGKHEQQGWLAGYLLLGVCPAHFPFSRHPLAVLACIARYFMSSGPVSPTSQGPLGPSSWLSAYCGDDPLTSRSGGGHALSESGLQ